MELITEPDTYCPSIDELGQYVDKIPSFNMLPHGIRCSCGSRKDKTYNNYSVFYQHCKTKMHQKWLLHLNENRANHYIEKEELKQLVENQKLIIAKMEREIRNKILTIDYLTQQIIYKQSAKVVDLLEIDCS